MEQHELEKGYWLPDDDDDYGYPFEGVPEGHGTQTAIVAGGLQSGVAREAGLYMIKAGGAVLDKDGNVVEEVVHAGSLNLALHHIVEKLGDGTLVKGKTVLIIDTREYFPLITRDIPSGPLPSGPLPSPFSRLPLLIDGLVLIVSLET